MTTFPENSLKQDLSSETIPKDVLIYMTERTCNRFHEMLLLTYLELQESEGLTKAKLASKIGKKPEQITRWLETPNNMTIGSIAKILAGMGQELSPKCEGILNKPISNRGHRYENILAFPNVSTSFQSFGSTKKSVANSRGYVRIS